MTNERAIEILKNLEYIKILENNVHSSNSDCKKDNDDYSALQMAISALEHRTAKKATDIYDENLSEKFDCTGKLNPCYEKAIFGCCPQCRFEVQDKMKFCLECGQALDWT